MLKITGTKTFEYKKHLHSFGGVWNASEKCWNMTQEQWDAFKARWQTVTATKGIVASAISKPTQIDYLRAAKDWSTDSLFGFCE